MQELPTEEEQIRAKIQLAMSIGFWVGIVMGMIGLAVVMHFFPLPSNI